MTNSKLNILLSSSWSCPLTINKSKMKLDEFADFGLREVKYMQTYNKKSSEHSHLKAKGISVKYLYLVYFNVQCQ